MKFHENLVLKLVNERVADTHSVGGFFVEQALRKYVMSSFSRGVSFEPGLNDAVGKVLGSVSRRLPLGLLRGTTANLRATRH